MANFLQRYTRLHAHKRVCNPRQYFFFSGTAQTAAIHYFFLTMRLDIIAEHEHSKSYIYIQCTCTYYSYVRRDCLLHIHRVEQLFISPPMCKRRSKMPPHKIDPPHALHAYTHNHLSYLLTVSPADDFICFTFFASLSLFLHRASNGVCLSVCQLGRSGQFSLLIFKKYFFHLLSGVCPRISFLPC